MKEWFTQYYWVAALVIFVLIELLEQYFSYRDEEILQASFNEVKEQGEGNEDNDP